MIVETQRTSPIQYYTSQLLQLAGIQEPPVPVEQIAQRRGACLRYVSYDGELSGLLFEEQGQAIIGVNMAHPKTRQRFTIAHELGHLELHHWHEFHIDRNFHAVSRLQGDKLEISSQSINAMEVDASRFAIELLMPATMLLKDVQGYAIDYENDELLVKLAERYQVSLQAMIFRLTSLGFALSL